MSNSVDSLQNVGWRFRRKGPLLFALCFVVLLSYTMYRYRTGTSSPSTAANRWEARSHNSTKYKINTTRRVSSGSINETLYAGNTGPTRTTATKLLLRRGELTSHVGGKTLKDNSSYSDDFEEEPEYSSSSESGDVDADWEDDEVTGRLAGHPKGEERRRLPKAIIIGVKKGGTRALLEFLRANPDVAVAGKEMHYFDHHYDQELEWYRKSMPYSYEDQITLEKTPAYFFSPDVPRRIYRTMRDTRFLVVVRDPVKRAISDHAQSLAKGKNTPFEEKAMRSYKQCTVNEDWSAIRIGLYDEHLTNWLKYFPISQFLFISGEKLVKNPGPEMEKAQTFLHVRRTLTKDSFVFDKRKGFPCLKEDSGLPNCLGENKGRPHPSVDPHVVDCLRRFYRPHNQRFYKLTRINFGWDD